MNVFYQFDRSEDPGNMHLDWKEFHSAYEFIMNEMFREHPGDATLGPNFGGPDGVFEGEGAGQVICGFNQAAMPDGTCQNCPPYHLGGASGCFKPDCPAPMRLMPDGNCV